MSKKKSKGKEHKEVSKFDNISLLKKSSIDELKLLKLEFEHHKDVIRKAKHENPYFVKMIKEKEAEKLFIKREDKKYASLIIEAFAIVEHFLKAIYKEIIGLEYKNKTNGNKSKTNFTKDIEGKLKGKVKFENNVDDLRLLRNKIVHNDFSLESNKLGKYKSMKSKKIVKEVFKDVKKTIKSIESNNLPVK